MTFSVPAIGMPGATELIILLVIVLILFGPGKLPGIGAALGKGIRGFKDNVEPKDPGQIDVSPADAAEEAEERLD